MTQESRYDNIRSNIEFVRGKKEFNIPGFSYIDDCEFMLSRISQLEAKCHQQQLEIAEMRNELQRSIP